VVESAHARSSEDTERELGELGGGGDGDGTATPSGMSGGHCMQAAPTPT
jgi:hypothetical protein